MSKDKLAKGNKMAHGVFSPDMYKPESKLNLEGEHAAKVRSHKIGDKVQLVVGATKTSHSMGSDKNHSASYRIHSVKMQEKNEFSGPNQKGAKNDEASSESHQ